MIRRSFEIDDGRLLNAKTTRTHRHLPLRSKERRQGSRYRIVSTILRRGRRPPLTPRCQANVRPRKPLKTSACRNRNKLRPSYNVGATLASSEVSANQEQQDCEEDPPSTTDRSRRLVRHRGPDGTIEERRQTTPPSAHSHRDSEAWAPPLVVLPFYAFSGNGVWRDVRGALPTYSASIRVPLRASGMDGRGVA
ncbi:hypothetical protein MTO96_006749 [Rhipicephalus appendiculatus]